ncbi:MAG: MlaD family protein [Patescibacteria group bacterium]|nr:MlaD family protein [Patescibacteria group bacterium]
MDERTIQFRVGVMVAATILITLILVFMFGDFHQMIHGTYNVQVWLREAPGVAVDTPVRKSGILIGRVTAVQFAENIANAEEIRQSLGISETEFTRGVVITMAIQSDKRIYDNEVCSVRTSLLGDAVVQINRTDEPVAGPYGPEGTTGPEGPAGGRQVVGPGQWMRGEIAADPVQSVRDLAPKLESVIASIETTSNSIRELSGKFNRLLDNNEEDLGRAIGKAADTLDAIQQLADGARTVFGDEKTQLDIRNAIERLPIILEDTHKAVVQTQHSMATFNRSLQNIEEFTEPLGQNASQMVGRVDSSLAKLDQLAGELVQFSQAINNSEGTLGQLIHNPELYQNLNRTIRNVEHLTRKLEPIIDDARVFSDKVSRNPGVIVRDAVRPGAGLK